MTRVPRSLTKKYVDLARERQALKARLADVETGLAAVAYALKVVDPEWKAPKALPRPQKRITGLPRGKVAAGCLEALRRQGELSTPELVRLIAAQNRLTFADKQAEQDFASSVAMALRRYERQGLVEEIGRDERTGALRWRLRTGADGRLSVVARAAAA